MAPSSLGSGFAGRRIVVWGLGRFGGGVGVTRWLIDRGAHVVIVDRADGAELAAPLAELTDLPIDARLGREDPSDLDGADLIVVNPAVDKRRSPLFAVVTDRGLPWTTEMNLFMERCPARTIGVTGSFGKSTTAAMIAAVLRATGSGAPSGTSPSGSCDTSPRASAPSGSYGTSPRARQPSDSYGASPPARQPSVYLGGNFGGSLLVDLDRMREHDWVVVEMSDAQLEDLPRIDARPDHAVVTMLAPHHLARHGSYDAYLRVKSFIVGAGRTHTLVLGPMPSADERRFLARVGPTPAPIVHVPSEVVPPLDLSVPGAHNQSNAMTALALCTRVGVDDAVARRALSVFPGLPHRLERVGVSAGVTYVNDSKATSPTATRAAVGAFPRAPLVVIVGGADGDEPLGPCARVLIARSRAVICAGASAEAWERALRRIDEQATRARVVRAADVPSAVSIAATMARPGDIVLFSPGATSYDRYPNFQARGAHFVGLVRALGDAAATSTSDPPPTD